MAEIMDRTVPYEVLIRFGESGEPVGAHVQRRRIVTLDGETLKDEVLPAAPLGLDDFPTSAIMDETTKSALAEIDRLRRDVAARDALIDEAARTINDLSGKLSGATAKIAALEQRGAPAEAAA